MRRGDSSQLVQRVGLTNNIYHNNGGVSSTDFFRLADIHPWLLPAALRII